MFNIADGKDITDLIKQKTQQEEKQEVNQFVVPFAQNPFIAITNEESGQMCNLGFNDSQNISNDCKTFISGDRQEVNWNNFFQECVNDVKSLGKNQLDNAYKYIDEFIQNLVAICVDNNIS